MKPYSAIKICHDNNIKIYPVVVSLYSFKIEIDVNGNKKRGDLLYNYNTQKKQLNNKIIELHENFANTIRDRQ